MATNLALPAENWISHADRSEIDVWSTNEMYVEALKLLGARISTGIVVSNEVDISDFSNYVVIASPPSVDVHRINFLGTYFPFDRQEVTFVAGSDGITLKHGMTGDGSFFMLDAGDIVLGSAAGEVSEAQFRFVGATGWFVEITRHYANPEDTRAYLELGSAALEDTLTPGILDSNRLEGYAATDFVLVGTGSGVNAQNSLNLGSIPAASYLSTATGGTFNCGAIFNANQALVQITGADLTTFRMKDAADVARLEVKSLGATDQATLLYHDSGGVEASGFLLEDAEPFVSAQVGATPYEVMSTRRHKQILHTRPAVPVNGDVWWENGVTGTLDLKWQEGGVVYKADVSVSS